MDALEKVIRPIVDGQIRGFIKEHPCIVEAVDWYKPRNDKATTFVNSLAKRIVRDLTCSITRARLAAAVVECLAAQPRKIDRGTADCGDSGLSGTDSGETAPSRALLPELTWEQ